jgi:uncharacterized small protein (DUF1192 family)
MKKLVLSLSLIFAGAMTAYSQSPEAINYQAVARDGAGALLSVQSLDVRIGVYSGSGGAVQEYEETHTVTTNNYGQFNLKIGEGTPTSGTFAAIDWASDEHHLKVEVDDGSGYVDLGTTQLVSVPYAMHASTADVAGPWGLNGNEAYYNGGKVGIGTDVPLTGFELTGDANYFTRISLDNTTGEDWHLGSHADGTFQILHHDITSETAFLIEPVGHYVGIGTDTPDQKLSVHSDVGISYVRVSDGTSGPASGLRMGMSGSGNAYIINDYTTASLSLGTEGTTRMRINSSGHIGVNDLSPDMMFHIKQDQANRAMRLEHNSTTDFWDNGVGTTTKNYKFYYNNLFRADISSVDGGYAQSSDRRLKSNIRYTESVLERVMRLRPATYNYIGSENSSFRSRGFVAQEVEEVFPDLVRDMDDGYKGIVYDGFAVISIKAIQELNEQIIQLQQEVEELKKAVKQ